MQLHSQVFPDHPEDLEPTQTPLIIIPGLFGSVSNWRGMARQFSETQPVHVVDQRNHGRSPHAASHTFADMVSDLHQYCLTQRLERVALAGHSMGGKVAMLFTLQFPELVNKLIVLDIAPVAYNHSHAPFINELLALDLSQLKSRKQADLALQSAIPDTATRLFLLQSLAGSPGEYYWRLNLQVLADYMEELTGFPETTAQSDVATLIVGGELSSYLLPEHRPQIQQLFNRAEFSVIPQAGHWLHAEQPQRVFAVMQEFLQR